jgi:hypothetical protein
VAAVTTDDADGRGGRRAPLMNLMAAPCCRSVSTDRPEMQWAEMATLRRPGPILIPPGEGVGTHLVRARVRARK